MGLVILRVPKAGAVRAAEASQLCTEEAAAVQVETASGSEGEKRETAMEQYLRVVETRLGVQLRTLVETQVGNGLGPRWAGEGALLFLMKSVMQLLPGEARQTSDPRRQPSSLVSKRHR